MQARIQKVFQMEKFNLADSYMQMRQAQRGNFVQGIILGFMFMIANSSYRLQGVVNNGLRWKYQENQVL